VGTFVGTDVVGIKEGTAVGTTLGTFVGAAEGVRSTILRTNASLPLKYTTPLESIHIYKGLLIGERAGTVDNELPEMPVPASVVMIPFVTIRILFAPNSTI
jgi:hypothetical protein